MKLNLLTTTIFFFYVASVAFCAFTEKDCDKNFQYRKLCRALIPIYYYKRSAGKCEIGFYSGCHSTANNFRSEKECNETALPICNKASRSLDYSPDYDYGDVDYYNNKINFRPYNRNYQQRVPLNSVPRKYYQSPRPFPRNGQQWEIVDEFDVPRNGKWYHIVLRHKKKPQIPQYDEFDYDNGPWYAS